MKPVLYLIGLPACGKTTLGQYVSRRCSVPFIDLDSTIEEMEGMSVAQIFRQKGEASFRALESEELRRVERGIVATGGGTPCYHGNMDFMLASGTVVLLEADRSRIRQRILLQEGKRPLVASFSEEQIDEYISRTEAERRPYYRSAPRVFDATQLDTLDEINRTVDRFITEYADVLALMETKQISS